MLSRLFTSMPMHIMVILFAILTPLTSYALIFTSRYNPEYPPTPRCTGIIFSEEEQLQIIKGGNKLRQYLIDTDMQKNHLLIPTITILQTKTSNPKKRCILDLLKQAYSFPVYFGQATLQGATPYIAVDFLSVMETLDNLPVNNMPLTNKSTTKRVYPLSPQTSISLPTDHGTQTVSPQGRATFNCNEPRETVLAGMCPSERTNDQPSSLYEVMFDHGVITSIAHIYQE